MEKWGEIIEQWVEMKSARSGSPHTRRSYATAMARWLGFLAAREPAPPLWEADSSHVRAWQQALRAQGLSEATVNHQLSCVSSFYSFVMGERRVVNGVEVGVFVDRTGKARSNPFRASNVQRGRPRSYERARVLAQAEVSLLLGHLERDAGDAAGARAYALILTYLYTGWRSAELLRMRWGDIRPSRSQADAWVYAWHGKGNKAQDDVLPGVCYRAICAYLHRDGRLLPQVGVEPGRDEPVWLPLSKPPMEGLRGSPQLTGQPISDSTALRVLRAALRGAGIRHWEHYRVHDLRHTHAHLLLESGLSLPQIQQRLHHSSLATTGLYVRAVHSEDPVDEVSRAFAQLRLHTESAPE